MAVGKSGTKRKAAASSSSLASTRQRKTRRAAPAKKQQQRSRKRASARRKRDSSDSSDEYDDDGDENDDSDDSDGEDGGDANYASDGEPSSSYADDTVHPDTMRFLQGQNADLAKNNDREWFHGHKDIYKRALGDFKTFCTVLQEEVTKVDWTVPVLPLEKHNLFRIYRDIRFSSSKVPYKEYFSVAFSRTGKQGLYAKYYLSVQAGDQSFIGGGLWHPEATHVSLMRRAIDKNPRGLKDILVSKDFYANFLDAGSAGGRKPVTGKKKIEELALKSFVERNSEDALKTAPKGYDKEHPDIELLRLKSYTVGKRITDAEILLPNAMEQLVEIIRTLEPFVSYLNSVVMPDIGLGQGPNQDDNDDDDDDDDDDEDDDEEEEEEEEEEVEEEEE
ncbi:hypothetical protein Dda_2914 [Drechslerella dactyloides]|uniref:DUF2461 domain-containing protein n=1 Tax=Drechslerella dactyloides TaxID=74499 RepID=A0AAD6J0C8_DREDA|nr:hypothetical protein Dda_2914 [Drechslerella dactyloides]